MSTLAGKQISRDGLGLMRMNLPPLIEDEQAFKVLKASLKLGMNLWNGADFYGTPDENSLHRVKRYFTQYPEDADKVVLCIKTGITGAPATLNVDCSPATLRKRLDDALRILDGKKSIDIFGIARVDPNVPVEDSVRALAEFKKEGKIGGIQLSEVRAETIQRAVKVTKIDMVEAELSLWSTDILSNGVTEVCAENGIVVLAHTPLGGGFFGGQIRSLDDLPPNSPFRHRPRFHPDNFPKNLKLLDALDELAKRKGCTPAQLALSWIKFQSKSPGMPVLIPIAGARSEARAQENATDVNLSDDDCAAIDSILATFPVEGARVHDAVAKLNEY